MPRRIRPQRLILASAYLCVCDAQVDDNVVSAFLDKALKAADADQSADVTREEFLSVFKEVRDARSPR